jgi:hypothetical protein
MKSVLKIVVLAAVLSVIAVGVHAAAGDIAKPSFEAARVQWDMQAPYERLVLTVSTPGGKVVRQEVGAGQMPEFDLSSVEGAVDGAYTWELRLIPKFDAEVRKALAEARRKGDDAAIDRMRAEGKIPADRVQSGSFLVEAGSFVAPGETEQQGPKGVKSAKDAAKNVTAADQVIPDDLIVQGSECVGLDCVNNENFGFDTIRLKENNTRIHFDDTSTSAGFPANDWRLIANDSASGGSSKFSIEDSTGSKTPFTITAGAATNSIFVDSTGRVGLRTSTPVLDLHINTSNTPAIRLEQNNSGGFTAQTWDIGANEANFFVRDVTGGSKLSLRIRPGAPTSSLDISADGDVGVGTASPDDKLEVADGNVHVSAANNTTDRNVAVGPDIATGTTTFNFGYGGASFGIGSAFLNSKATGATAPNPSIRFLVNTSEKMIIDNEGFIGLGVANPTSPIHHSSGAILTAGGTWQNGSSRDIKQDIVDLNADEAMTTLRGLDPVKYAYKVDPKEHHVGFIAEDVPDLVAAQDRKSLSPMDIVAVLTKVVQEQQKTIDKLTERLNQLEQQKQ